jgi:hypothetical protein
MNHKETFYCGTTKIKNPNTLQRWIDMGWYQKQIDDGYTFATGCGRFSLEICKCSKCKNLNNGLELKTILENNNI